MTDDDVDDDGIDIILINFIWKDQYEIKEKDINEMEIGLN